MRANKSGWRRTADGLGILGLIVLAICVWKAEFRPGPVSNARSTQYTPASYSIAQPTSRRNDVEPSKPAYE